MAITIIKDLPSIVCTRNNTWMEVELSSGPSLQVEISHASVILVRLKFPVDSSHRVAFNLRRFLEAMGTVPDLINVHLPAFNQTIPTNFTRNLKAFKVVLTELASDGTVIVSTEVNSRCLLAGINAEFGYTTTLEQFLAITPKRFLTNKPLRKETRPESQEYLYFYNQDPAFVDNISVKFRIFFDDGSVSGLNTFNHNPYDFSSPAAAILPVGYKSLGIEYYVPDGKAATAYEVFVTASGLQTESHLFEIDRSCSETAKELIFLNSLGGVDTVQLRTVEEINLSVEKELIEGYVGANATLEAGQYFDNDVRSVRIFKALTGFKTREERRWLQELFASERVYEVSDGKFLPISITSRSMPLDRGITSLQTVLFDYRYRFDDIGYTRPL